MARAARLETIDAAGERTRTASDRQRGPYSAWRKLGEAFETRWSTYTPTHRYLAYEPRRTARDARVGARAGEITEVLMNEAQFAGTLRGRPRGLHNENHFSTGPCEWICRTIHTLYENCRVAARPRAR